MRQLVLPLDTHTKKSFTNVTGNSGKLNGLDWTVTKFSKIESPKLYVRVAEQIMEQIQDGVLKRGGRLPAEREIAAQMGIGRPSVREALIALELLGVVEIHIGQGTYVVGAPVSITKLQTNLNSPFELLEARDVIESNVAVLATRKYGQGTSYIEALERAEAITDEMKSMVANPNTIENFYKLGLSFHKALAESSNNAALTRIVSELVQATSHPLWSLINKKFLEDSAAREEMIREHEEITVAIRNGEAQKALEAMQHHIEELSNWSLR